MNHNQNEIIRPNTIVLATDGSDEASLAARAAADLSRKTGAQLHVAHAWHHHVQALGYPTMAWTDYSYLDEREARKVLLTQVDALEAADDLFVEPHLLQGSPVDAILDLCEELRPGLLVMGSRGLGPVGRLLVGSVSEGVVHHARCPVLVLRGGDEAWPPKRVVAGDDGSEGARRAAELAGGIAALFKAQEVLVRARRNPPEPIGGWSAQDRRRFDEARSKELEALNERAEAIEGTVGRHPNTRVVDSDATLALLEVAEEGDEGSTLMALGSRGLGTLGRVRLGSVSTNVLRAARGPVLIHALPVGELAGEAAPSATASATRERTPERVVS
jgi:nucleotide-binding universal stress UspA family protein